MAVLWIKSLRRTEAIGNGDAAGADDHGAGGDCGAVRADHGVAKTGTELPARKNRTDIAGD